MCEVWTMGEMLVEIMRTKVGAELFEPNEFIGPYPSGAPAIFIDTVARLGHTSGIIGGVGKDDFGKNLMDRLKKDGVNVDFVNEDASESTAVAFVTYFEDGSRKFIFHIGNTAATKTKDVKLEAVENPKYFHIMGCSLSVSEDFRNKIIRTALDFVDHGAKISFDPNIRPELLKGSSMDEMLGDVLRNCSVMMPGVEELKMITGEGTIEAGIAKLFEYEKMELVALKKGSQGSTLYTRNETVDCPLYEVVQVDPTGAGDCFDGALLCGLLEKKSLLECGKLASAAGALNVMKRGPMEGDINLLNIKEIINE